LTQRQTLDADDDDERMVKIIYLYKIIYLVKQTTTTKKWHKFPSIFILFI